MSIENCTPVEAIEPLTELMEKILSLGWNSFKSHIHMVQKIKFVTSKLNLRME